MILLGPILMFGGLLLVCWLGTPDERELRDLLAREEDLADARDHLDREREQADEDWARGPSSRPVARALARMTGG